MSNQFFVNLQRDPEEVDFTRSILEALKKLEEQLQILHKVCNDRKSDPGIKKMKYFPRKLESSEKKTLQN